MVIFFGAVKGSVFFADAEQHGCNCVLFFVCKTDLCRKNRQGNARRGRKTIVVDDKLGNVPGAARGCGDMRRTGAQKKRFAGGVGVYQELTDRFVKRFFDRKATGEK